MHKMNKILPSTNSIDIPNQDNIANSLIQIRSSKNDSMQNPQRGRKIVGSERFNIKGISPQKLNYNAQNPISPFKKNNINERFSRHGYTSPSTSTSLSKFPFKKNSKINLNNTIKISKSGLNLNESISKMNSISMKELRDIDVSPEKR